MVSEYFKAAQENSCFTLHYNAYHSSKHVTKVCDSYYLIEFCNSEQLKVCDSDVTNIHGQEVA